MAEREKADLLHDAISLARSDGMVVRSGVDPSTSGFLDRRSISDQSRNHGAPNAQRPAEAGLGPNHRSSWGDIPTLSSIRHEFSSLRPRVVRGAGPSVKWRETPWESTSQK